MQAASDWDSLTKKIKGSRVRVNYNLQCPALQSSKPPRRLTMKLFVVTATLASFLAVNINADDQNPGTCAGANWAIGAVGHILPGGNGWRMFAFLLTVFVSAQIHVSGHVYDDSCSLTDLVYTPQAVLPTTYQQTFSPFLMWELVIPSHHNHF